MNKVVAIKQSYELIRRDLGLEEEWVFEDSSNPFDRLHELLTLHIRTMIDQDFNQLLNTLYRIDISESKLKQILTQDDVAGALATAVIERQKEKVATRRAYRS